MPRDQRSQYNSFGGGGRQPFPAYGGGAYPPYGAYPYGGGYNAYGGGAYPPYGGRGGGGGGGGYSRGTCNYFSGSYAYILWQCMLSIFFSRVSLFLYNVCIWKGQATLAVTLVVLIPEVTVLAVLMADQTVILAAVAAQAPTIDQRPAPTDLVMRMCAPCYLPNYKYVSCAFI